MARNFINGDEIRITVKDKIFCDVEFFSGQKFTDLEPRRLFPVSGHSQYITFLDENGDELLVTIDDDDEFERVSDFFEDELFGEVDYDEANED